MSLRTLCLCLSGILPLSNAVAQSPLSTVPSDASVVIRYASVESLESSASAFAEQLEEGAGENAIAAVREIIGEIVNDQELAGVDTSADWYLAVFADGTGEPDVVMMIPATDGDEILSNINAEGVFRDGYVLASPNDADVESLLDASEAESVLKEIPDLDAFNAAHLAVFVNADHLVSTYSDEIDLAQRQVNMALDQLEQMEIPNAQVDVGAVIEIYRGMLDWADDTLADAEALTLTVNVNEAEIVVDSRLVYREGSESADALETGGPEVTEALASLPEGMAVYYSVSGAGLGELMEWGMSMSLSMVGNDSEQLESMIDRMSEMGFGVMSGCVSLPDGDLPLRGVSTVEVDDIQGYRELTQDMQEAVGEISVPGLRQTTTIEEEAETYGDYTADVITVKQEFEGPFGAQQQQVNDYLFGEDGMVTRMVYDEDAVLSTVGGGPELMEAAIEAYEGGEGDLSEWSDGAIDDPTLLVLLDLPALIQQVIHIASAAVGNTFPLPPQIMSAVEEMELETSYITISAGSEENSCLTRISVPAEQIRPIMTFVYLAAPAGQQ